MAQMAHTAEDVLARVVSSEIALELRDELRRARASALRSSENFIDLLFVFERIGSLLCGRLDTLSGYAGRLRELAGRSPLSRKMPREWHTPFAELLDSVRLARNDALHQGAFARHLTQHAIELAIVLEDALMADRNRIGDYMVRSPVCAARWHPFSFIRQLMLENSFSYLPIETTDGSWRLVSDRDVAEYLRCSPNRDAALARSIADAEGDSTFKTVAPSATLAKEESVRNALTKMTDGRPVLVIETISGADAPPKQVLLGIVTAFDLL